MVELSQKVVARWHNRKVTGKWCPVSVNIMCSHCGRMVNMVLNKIELDRHRDTIGATCKCPNCQSDSFLWVVHPNDASQNEERGCKSLCMYPAPILKRKSVLPLNTSIDLALERAYLAAIEAFNVGLWDASAASCIWSLEGIVHSLKPTAKGSLFDKLKVVFSDASLLDPLIHVTDTLRKGSNLGAHFDLEKQTDDRIAGAMLDLLDFVFEYTFVLETKSKELESELVNLGPSST